MSEHILLRHRDIADIDKIEVYLAHGGFEALRKAVTSQTPAQVQEVVKASGLRGRGGAGFPTGLKWTFLPKDVVPHYLVVNADESEPGTFKDREIMERNPFQFLEGVALAAFAAQAERAYLYCRGEFWDLTRELDRHIAKMRAAGWLGEHIQGSGFSLEIFTHLGAGAYICGEETALLESLEGKIGQPRIRPPFPATYGLYGKPTVVNNVETLTNLPPIVARGAAWYRSIGTPKSSGPKVFSLSGHVNRPGNYELPLGTTFRTLIYEKGGGLPGGRKPKAIMPAGASSTLLRATEAVLDTPMDYESVAAAGSLLGSASVIVLDETVDMSWLALKTSRFFKHESCGKCTPCREGTYWMLRLLEHIQSGQASAEGVVLLGEVAGQIQNKCLCPLGEFAIGAVQSGLALFAEDFQRHISQPTPRAEAVVVSEHA
jgi:NADH-quinone oxidoreductase subunit F